MMPQTFRCWCGNRDLQVFSPGYLHCPVCETLVAAHTLTTDIVHITDDDHDFYGREYWFSHQEKDLGFMNIVTRARSDLAERCLHWLRTVLKYKLPPAKILELGSAHGGFVALLCQAGYDATGLELSPWIVDFARKTFEVPMLLGPIEDQSLEPGTLDAIVFMDVLEHFADPVRTMQYCLDLLTPDGLLVLQTPHYPEGGTYQEMLATQDPFLEQLKTNEHLFLFSQQSVRELFRRLGALHLAFEPAMFAHYDMFLVVSRKPLASNLPEVSEQRLTQTVSGRMVQALLDVEERRQVIQQKWREAEADREARLSLLKEQGNKLGLLEAKHNESQAHVAALSQQITLSERDRAERLTVIESLGEQLGRAKAERNEAHLELNDLGQRFAAAEADREARLQVINDLGQQLAAANHVGQQQAMTLKQLRQEQERLNSHWLVRILYRLKLLKKLDSQSADSA